MKFVEYVDWVIRVHAQGLAVIKTVMGPEALNQLADMARSRWKPKHRKLALEGLGQAA